MKLIKRIFKYFMPLFAGEGGDGSSSQGEGGESSNSGNEGAGDDSEGGVGKMPPLNDFARRMEEAENAVEEDKPEKEEEGEKEEEKEETQEEEVDKTEKKDKEEKKEEFEEEGKEKDKEGSEEKDETELHDVFKKLKDKFKDEEIEPGGEESLDKINDWIEDLQGKNEQMTKEAEGIVNMFNGNPDFHDMANLVYHGMDAKEAFVRTFGAEGLEEAKGEPDNEMMKAAIESRKKRLSEDKAAKEEFKANQQKTIQNIDTFQKKHKLSEKETNEFLKRANETLNNAVNGLVSEEFLTKQFLAENIESEKSKAAKKAAIEERNKKIEEKKKRVEKKEEGDGTPRVNSGAKVGDKKETTDYFGDSIKRHNDVNDRIYQK